MLFSIFTACNESPVQVYTHKNEGRIKLRCVIPSEDSNKLQAFKTFSTDIKALLPNYDVSFDFIKGDVQTYQTKIKVLLSSKDAPDVFLSNGGNFSNELFSENAVQPIDKYLDDLKFWSMVLSSSKIEGHNEHIYAVPFYDVHYQIIEVNTDLFQKNNVKMPTNFDELKTAVSTFKSKGIIPISLGGKDGSAVYTMVESFAHTLDPEITTNIVKGKAKFSDEPFKQSAAKVKELLNMGAFQQKVESYTEADAANLFYSGKAAMYCTSSANFNISDQKLKGKCGLLYYPFIDKSKESDFSNVVGGVAKDSGLLVSATSQHPREAVELAVEMSKYYNRYLYEKQNNAEVIYIPDKLGWKLHTSSPLGIQQLMDNLTSNKNTTAGLLQNNISPKASKAILDDSSAFITGLLSTDNYTKEMDKGLKLK